MAVSGSLSALTTVTGPTEEVPAGKVGGAEAVCPAGSRAVSGGGFGSIVGIAASEMETSHTSWFIVISNSTGITLKIHATVDWADRESSEAAIRRKIRRLLRQHHYQPTTAATAVGGGEGPYDVNHYTQLELEQAKALYRYWPEVEGRLFE